MKKRILYTGPFDPKLCDGISSSMFDLLTFLKKRDHEVFIVSFMHDMDYCRDALEYTLEHSETKIVTRGENYCNFTMRGIDIYYELLPYTRNELLGNHPKVLKRYIKKMEDYNNSYTFTVDIDLTCLFANWLIGNQSAHFIRSPVVSINLYRHSPVFREVLRKKTVFTVSKFAQGKLQESLDVEAFVWPPLIDIDRFRFPNKVKVEKKIGYYSAGPHKGDNLVHELINKMPSSCFVIMGRCYSYHPDTAADNVIYLGNTMSFEDFYGEISLLLVPSVIDEGYSRVILEAFANGIPVIANRIGGIPESIGAAGIMIDIESSQDKMISKYISAITKILDDPQEYKQQSNKALERYKEYEREIYQKSAYYDDKFLCENRARP